MAGPALQAAASGKEPPDPSMPDPSMEDILASIRRILNDGDGESPPGAEGAPAQGSAHLDTSENDDVFLLEPSMMIDTAKPHEADRSGQSGHPVYEPETASPPPFAAALHDPEPYEAAMSPEEEPWERLPEAAAPLLAPEAMSAAKDSLGMLRGLHGRTMPINRGAALTLEDIVRDEMRPLLKAWLDEHLPPLVERLVRAEIERVTAAA